MHALLFVCHLCISGYCAVYVCLSAICLAAAVCLSLSSIIIYIYIIYLSVQHVVKRSSKLAPLMHDAFINQLDQASKIDAWRGCLYIASWREQQRSSDRMELQHIQIDRWLELRAYAYSICLCERVCTYISRHMHLCADASYFHASCMELLIMCACVRAFFEATHTLSNGRMGAVIKVGHGGGARNN